MKKETLELALHNVVSVELKDNNNRYIGWLIKDRYSKNRYKVLPIHYTEDDIICFTASIVKSITYISNGVVLR